MKRFLCAMGMLAGGLMAAGRGDEILLWPNGAPGADPAGGPDSVQMQGTDKSSTRIQNVHKPSIAVFLPSKEKANGMAVVVAPGGGHSSLVIGKEGYDIADWLNSQGIAAFVLKYRLAKSPGSHYTVQGDTLPDALRSVRLVRQRAKEWGVDPARIGFMGFSAGGEVAALAETRFDAGNDSAPDAIDRVSSRPDFAVVVYPGYKPGTITVPKNAPPTFLVCADNDPSHVVATVNLYLDLQKQGVSTEMHIYASGGHGFALRDQHAPVSAWNERLKEWMVERKLLAKM